MIENARKLEKMIEDLGTSEIVVVATGGQAALLGPATKHIQQVDSHLTLEGLRLIHKKNHL